MTRRDNFRWRLWGLWVLLLAVAARPTQAALPRAVPECLGMNSEHLRKIDSLVAEGIAQKKMPGCVVCLGRRGQIAFLKAYGFKQTEPNEIPMTTDTVFDMASITKPVATATSVMLLVERGRLRLSDKAADHIPDFAEHDKGAITIRDLLIHQSGLISDNPLADYQDGPEEAFRRINQLKLTAPIGSKFMYSDVNFILLGEIVRKVSGQPLNEFAQENIFSPLGMCETCYLPNTSLRKRAAPTEKRNGEWIAGEVHDPRAHKLGGVAGHAGLFSTANDLAIYATMLLNGGEFCGTRVLACDSIAAMGRGEKVSTGLRGLGWDKRTGYSSNRGDLLSDAAFGHGGFTGTVLWIDPGLDLFFIFLSNRVHPNGKGSVNQLAGKIANVAAESIVDRAASDATKR